MPYEVKPFDEDFTDEIINEFKEEQSLIDMYDDKQAIAVVLSAFQNQFAELFSIPQEYHCLYDEDYVRYKFRKDVTKLYNIFKEFFDCKVDLTRETHPYYTLNIEALPITIKIDAGSSGERNYNTSSKVLNENSPVDVASTDIYDVSNPTHKTNSKGNAEENTKNVSFNDKLRKLLAYYDVGDFYGIVKNFVHSYILEYNDIL